MGKPSAPPPPDYTPLAQASEAQLGLATKQFEAQNAQSDKQFGLQQDALNWAKGTYAADKATNDQVIAQQLATQKASADNAAKAQGRYESVYQPLEDQAVHESQTYDTPENQQLHAGSAMAGVAQQFQQQRVAAAQNLESFGVDPSSTRYAALDIGTRTNQAAAQAAAGQTAIQQTQDTARQLRANAINVGRGLPSDINAGNQTAIQAGNSGANVGLATTASGASTMGTSTQYGALGNQSANGATNAIGAGTGAIGAWGGALNNGYSNAMQGYTANQNSSSGIGSALGLAASFIPGLAEGGAVPGIATHEGATNGGAVPNSTSPSRGKAVDDVPARLTAGEFVLPRDVVQWKGEEFYQKHIAKAREDRDQTTKAKARPMAVPMQPAAFSSRPTAVPMR